MAKIIRAREEARFTVLPNQLLDDRRLSWAALGLLTWMLRLPPDWEIGGIKQIAAQKRGSLRREGRDTIAKCLKELEQAGYLSRERRQDPKTGRWETVTVVRSRPAAKSQVKAPTRSAQHAKPQVAPSPGNPGLGEPGPGFPGRTYKTVTKTDLPGGVLTNEQPGSAAGVEQAGRQAAKARERNRPEADQAAAEVVDPAAVEVVDGLTWPDHIRPDRGTCQRLVSLAARCLAAGHHPAAIRQAAEQAMPGARTAGSVVVALRRLADLTPDPALAEAAERAERQAQQERQQERMSRIPHRFVPHPRRPSYCSSCGRTELQRVHSLQRVHTMEVAR